MSKEYLSIGELVKRLQSIYPDLSVSKVRYLEDEGLLCPARTAGGYRKFSDTDYRRLERILYLQKAYFYPLSVIKELLDKEEDKPQVELQPNPERPPLPFDALDKKHPLEMIPELLGVEISFIRKLAEFGIIILGSSPKGRLLVDGKDLKIIQTAWDLKRYGVEPRHLKSYLLGVRRELLIFEQALSYLVGKQNQELSEEDKAKFKANLASMESLTQEIHSFLLHRELRSRFKSIDID